MKVQRYAMATRISNESNAFQTFGLNAITPTLMFRVCIGLLLGACTTLGTGSGTASPGNQPVSFTWTSKDGGVTGTLSATLSGAAFTGPYLEITQAVQTSQFYPMWDGWSPGWRDWGYGFNGMEGISTHYTGKVVSNLQGPGSQRMRCRFDLNEPRSGMGGGGVGKCQVAGGASIDAAFPLIMPASAMAADDPAQLLHEPAPAQRPSNERAWTDPFRNDPILVSRWGPGDPNLAVARFHF